MPAIINSITITGKLPQRPAIKAGDNGDYISFAMFHGKNLVKVHYIAPNPTVEQDRLNRFAEVLIMGQLIGVDGNMPLVQADRIITSPAEIDNIINGGECGKEQS